MSIKLDITKTITSIFIMPTVYPSVVDLKTYGYINAFGVDEEKDLQYENAIYALFKPKDLKMFNSFLEKEYKRTSLIIEDYNYGKEHVVIVYKQLPKFKEDYDLIKEGKYSKTSKEFQSLFPKTVYVYNNSITNEEYSIQYKIFNKTADLVQYWENKIGQKLSPEQEYWDIYDKNNETLKLEHGN